jgi:hypothetical protein
MYDRELLSANPQMQEDAAMECEVKLSKAQILLERSRTAEDGELMRSLVKESLQYHRYLLYKYLNNDQTKIRQVRDCLADKKLDEARTILQIYGLTNALHLQQLLIYLAKPASEEETKKRIVTEDCPLQEIKTIIQ